MMKSVVQKAQLLWLVGLWLLLLSGLSGCLHLQGVKKLSHKQAELTELRTISGEIFDLRKDVQKHKATVLFWWGNTCPCVKRYQARIQQLRKDFAKRGIQFYAIASNVDDNPVEIRKVAEKRKFNLPFIVDPNGRFARLMGVISTPTTMMLDSKGHVRFRGWLDNERKPGQSGRKPYLHTALNKLLAKKADKLVTAPVYGCTITRSFGSKDRRVTWAVRKKTTSCGCKMK